MSRDVLLSRIGRSFVATSVEQRRAVADARLKAPPQHPLPGVARFDGAGCVLELVEKLMSHGCDVEELASLEDAPAAIARAVGRHSLPPQIVVSPDSRLMDLDWGGAGLSPHVGASAARRVAISHGAAGVKETGTVVLASTAENPALLAFVPELHVVVLSRETIVACYEEALARLFRSDGDRGAFRAISLISGPSRTGDIGGRIVMGAHGPRSLAVLIY